MTRHEEGVSANGDASNESAAGSSNVIGRIHITTSNSRSGGLNSGSNQSNPLSQLIRFRSQRNSNRQRRCAYLQSENLFLLFFLFTKSLDSSIVRN